MASHALQVFAISMYHGMATARHTVGFGATQQLRTVARADSREGFVGLVLLDSISAALALHSMPYLNMDRTGALHLVALCMMS